MFVQPQRISKARRVPLSLLLRACRFLNSGGGSESRNLHCRLDELQDAME